MKPFLFRWMLQQIVNCGLLTHYPSRLTPYISRFTFYALLLLLLAAMSVTVEAQQIAVGSKRFTESYVLGEIAKKVLEDAGFSVEHRGGMGGTIIVWEALKNGGIALYPDYTGTIKEQILKVQGDMTLEEMRTALAEDDIGMTGELGFNNTYALTMRRETAEKLGVRKISDLRKHTRLKIGLTHEFLDRKDGWKPLSRHYGLQMQDIRGMEHALAYTALNESKIDVMDAYSTDAKLAEYDLTVLEDDLNFFPKYNAVFLYRLVDTAPGAIAAVRKLEGSIDEGRMIRLNAEAERTKDYTQAAALYFGEVARIEPFYSKITGWTARHLQLVGISMLIAILIGLPLGIWASRPGLFSQFIFGLTGIIQTIPSLALLVLFIPLLGIGVQTAVVALFLYSLLPIVRNTASGLQDIPTPLRESAGALGLEPSARLIKVFLPMASRTILTGIKTSAIINVGTATLAALIGAGGLGEPIISGLNLNDTETILQGAIPAAILALLVQFFFDFLDRLIIPKGLRLEASKG